MSVRATIARNTLFNMGGRAFEGVFGLALTWYLVQRLGAEGWGLWSLVAVFTGYAALFDLGFGSGFAKYIAEHDARDERHRISQVVSTGLAFYFVLSIAAVAVIWTCADLLLDFIIIPFAGDSVADPRTFEDLRFLCRGAALVFAVNNCIAPFANLPVGLQRMGVNNSLAMVVTVVKFAAAVAFIEAGCGVRGMLLAQGLSVCLFGVACVVAAFVIAPHLRVSPAHIDRAVFHQLFSFGWRTQVAKLANLINFQTDRMIVAAAYKFGDMGLVGLYGLGEYLAMKMRQGPALLVSALIPAASAMNALSREEQLEKLYLLATKYMAAVSVPLACYLVCAADLALRAWLGDQPGLDRAAWVMRILCVGYLVNLLPGPGMSIILGKGLAATPMFAGVISMAVNISSTLLLFWMIGFYGVPLGTMLGMAVSTAWFFLHARKHIRIPLGALALRALLWPALACLPGAAVTLAIALLLREDHGHLVNLAGLAGSGAAFGLSYLAVLRFAPFLDAFDRDFLLKTLRLEKLPGARLLIGGTASA